jgi:hypothetical protein
VDISNTQISLPGQSFFKKSDATLIPQNEIDVELQVEAFKMVWKDSKSSKLTHNTTPSKLRMPISTPMMWNGQFKFHAIKFDPNCGPRKNGKHKFHHQNNLQWTDRPPKQQNPIPKSIIDVSCPS